ncbi:MAG: zinc ribbon domain-containing protein [Candidatus Geothermincolales bacterium]
MGFFDKLKEQAASLGAQLDQALDTTKTKAQVASLRKNRADLVGQLGEALLEQFRRDEFDPTSLRQMAEQVFELERQILELERQVEAQRASQPQVVGQVPSQPQQPQVAPAGGFAAPPEARTVGDRCPSCGGELPEGSAFCPSCGSKV